MELEVARFHRLEVGLSPLPNNVLHCASANCVVHVRKFHPVGPADVIDEYWPRSSCTGYTGEFILRQSHDDSFCHATGA